MRGSIPRYPCRRILAFWNSATRDRSPALPEDQIPPGKEAKQPWRQSARDSDQAGTSTLNPRGVVASNSHSTGRRLTCEMFSCWFWFARAGRDARTVSATTLNKNRRRLTPVYSCSPYAATAASFGTTSRSPSVSMVREASACRRCAGCGPSASTCTKSRHDLVQPGVDGA